MRPKTFAGHDVQQTILVDICKAQSMQLREGYAVTAVFQARIHDAVLAEIDALGGSELLEPR